MVAASLFRGVLVGSFNVAATLRDDESVEIRWQRWCRWLRTRGLLAGNMTAVAINPLAVAERIERFEFKRWQGRYAKDGAASPRSQGGDCLVALILTFLQSAFPWLFRSGGQVIPENDLETHRQLVSAFGRIRRGGN